MLTQIVLLAYGPGFETFGAVRRARELVGATGRVWVVAALPTAAEGLALLATAPPAGVELVTETGTAGVRAALEAAGDVPTLLLHDDVLIDADAVAALLAGHRTTGSTVVPVVDDADCDHGPTSASASADAPPVPVRRIRPVCLLALPDDLYALTPRSLVDPRVRLDDVTWGFHLVPGSRARHRADCAQRLLSPDGPDGRPLLVAHVIVRDEERTLPGLLTSLEGLVDRIEVCDTGSVDRTVEIAEAAGCHVIHRTWRDDFAWARNEVLDRCRDAWFVLMVDADDRVHCDDPVLVRRQLATFRDEVDAYRVAVRSRLSMEREDLFGSEMLSIRIFRPDGVAWFGPIHEVPCARGTGDPIPAVTWEGLWIEHVGYTTEVLAGRDKATRNIGISRTAYEQEGTGKAALEYARSLMLADAEPREQLRLLLEVVEQSTGAAPPTRAYILATTAAVHLALGEHQEAHDRAEAALELVPADDIAARVYADACEALGRGDELVARADELARRPSLAPAFANAHGRSVWRARLAAALAGVGRLQEAATEAATVLATAPEWFDRWEALADAVVAGGLVEADLLAPLLAADTTGAGLDVVVRRLPPSATAELCAAAVVLGDAAAAEFVTTGIVAALIGRRDAAMVVLLGAVAVLDEPTRQLLAGRAEAFGRPDVAAALRQGSFAAPGPAR